MQVRHHHKELIWKREMLTKRKIRVLLIEDEEFDVQRVRNTIAPFKDDLEIKDVVSDGESALRLIRETLDYCDVVIMDYQIAGGLMGDPLIRKLLEGNLPPQIIVITKMSLSASDFSFATNLIKAGAFWYCTKYPIDIEDHIYQPTDLVLSIFNAFEKRELERAKLRSEGKLMKNVMDTLEEKKIVGVSLANQLMQGEIRKCAQSNANVIITGESGTGKELVAANIHFNSERRFENFVPINCGSIPTELLESELFGYQKGAFTGASVDKPGLFEVGNNGTIFLDEVSELSLSAQVKLLRVIQNGEIEKLGRTQVTKVDVRIIAATNKELKSEIKEKHFREDLYYRLNVVPINILPLRERREDIPVLVNHFLTLYGNEMRKVKPELSPDAEEVLCRSDWPGNVRELQNIVRRLLLNDLKIIRAENVLSAMGVAQAVGESTYPQNENLFEPDLTLSLREAEEAFRRKYVMMVREKCVSDAEASRKLGLLPSNYSRLIRSLGIK